MSFIEYQSFIFSFFFGDLLIELLNFCESLIIDENIMLVKERKIYILRFGLKILVLSFFQEKSYVFVINPKQVDKFIN